MSSTSSMSLPPSLDKIVKRFQRASSNKLRYEQLLWYAKKLPEFPESEKLPENKVQGCVSQVYVISSLDEGKVKYQADSDAQLTKGLVALLIEGIDGMTPKEICALTPDFIQDTGLTVSLTPSRANGFYNIFQFMQKRANSYLTNAPIESETDS